MALGRRDKERQSEFWAATGSLLMRRARLLHQTQSTLAEGGIDRWIEDLCEPHYAKTGRPGFPPGIYFRIMLVG